MIISIHQPNYLPWIGYFNKIARSDIFVIFDDVQFPIGKKGFFGNRNKIKTKNANAIAIENKINNRIKHESKIKYENEIQIKNGFEN